MHAEHFGRAKKAVNYFRLKDDIHFDRRWYLGDMKRIDNWSLVSGESLPALPQSLEVEVDRDGNEMDFTLTEAFGVPIVSSTLKDALADLPGIRFVPVTLLRQRPSRLYFAMLIEHLVECVDESRSEFEKFETEDPVRPDLAGHFQAFYKLVLDQAKADAASPLFRLARFPTAIIVGDAVRRLFEAVRATGSIMEAL